MLDERRKELTKKADAVKEKEPRDRGSAEEAKEFRNSAGCKRREERDAVLLRKGHTVSQSGGEEKGPSTNGTVTDKEEPTTKLRDGAREDLGNESDGKDAQVEGSGAKRAEREDKLDAKEAGGNKEDTGKEEYAMSEDEVVEY